MFGGSGMRAVVSRTTAGTRKRVVVLRLEVRRSVWDASSMQVGRG